MYKKFIAGILVTLMLVLQLVPMGVFADNSDLTSALDELKELKANHPEEVSEILGQLWEFAALENNGNGAVDTLEVYAAIRSGFVAGFSEEIWLSLVNETSSAVSGKIEKASLLRVIDEILERKDVIKEMYEAFTETFDNPYLKAVVKELLELGQDATDFEVYEAIMELAGPIITVNEAGSELELYGNAAENILANIGVGEVLTDLYEDSINNILVNYIEKLNDYIADFNISIANAVYALDIFGLYYEQETQASPTPDDPGGSGGSGGSNPTPSPTPSVVEDSDELTKNIEAALKDIKNEKDPEKAKEAAKDVIADSIASLQALADQGKSTAEAVAALENVANAVLEKINTKTVTATVADGKSTAVIDTITANELIAMLNKIAATAEELNKELAKASADAKIETVLNIVANTTADVSTVQLPAALLTAAADKKIDKIAVNTGIATISIAPDAIAATSAVSLTAGKVEASTLTDEQKAAVGDNVVFEFTAKAGDTEVTTFAKPVEIVVPYTLKNGEDPEKITVFFVNNSGVLENVIGTYDPETKTVKFTTSHFSKYVVKENKVVFSDLGSVEWARANIESMAAKGIIGGVGEGKYAPSDKLTRAQFAAMIVRAFKLEDATAENIFADVKSTDWYYSVVVSAYKAGVINGVSADKFAPNANVTRQEMAAMISRALVSVKGKSLTADEGKYISKFADKEKIDSFAVNGANLVSKYGVIGGKPGDLFDPKGYATRAEAAAVIYRAFNVK